MAGKNISTWSRGQSHWRVVIQNKYSLCVSLFTLQWRHDSISNHRPHDCLLKRLFRPVQIKENIKAPHHWPLWGEFTVDRWIPHTKGQQCGKCFHLMTSSWYVNRSYHYHCNKYLFQLFVLQCAQLSGGISRRRRSHMTFSQWQHGFQSCAAIG